LQFLAGYYPQADVGSDGVPLTFDAKGKPLPHVPVHLDLAPVAFRLGWEALTPWFEGTVLCGEPVLLLEWTADPVVRGFGNFVTGPSFLARYQLLRPNWHFVPYAQIGAGIVLNDAYHDQAQNIIGGPHEFLLQAQAGFHYFLSPSFSLDAEGGYQHISNADTYPRNTGLNSFGGSVGFTYYFGRKCCPTATVCFEGGE
jgi:hypothetical protein